MNMGLAMRVLSMIRSGQITKYWERQSKPKATINDPAERRYKWNPGGKWTSFGNFPTGWMEDQLSACVGWCPDMVCQIKAQDKLNIARCFHYVHQTAKSLSLCPGFHQQGCTELWAKQTRLELADHIKDFTGTIISGSIDWSLYGVCELVQEGDVYYVNRKYPAGDKVSGAAVDCSYYVVH